MSAPEPVEVEASELAAARERIANLEAGRDVEQQMLRNIAGQVVACQMKYDAALELVQEANDDRAEFKAERDTARAELARANDRLLRIAEAHSKSIDSAGGTWGDCAECGWSWPCPTNVWATTDRDVLAPWRPDDDEESDDA